MPEQAHLDKLEVRRAFDRAASSYDAHAVLQKEVSRRLMERMDYLRLQANVVLDVGCGTGDGARVLGRRFAGSQILALDLSTAMLEKARGDTPLWKRLLPRSGGGTTQYVCADMERLPVRNSAIDFVWSSLALQWAGRLEDVLGEFHRVLRPGGLVLFATFGPDTLKELRAAFLAIDDKPHVSHFVDMHDIGDMLIQQGFQNPVMEMEHLVLTYGKLKDLMQDLKRIGAHNADSDRSRGMMGKQSWHKLESVYEQYRAEGRLPATYEVIYGHAWAGSKDRLPDGSQVVRLNMERRRNFREKT